MLRTTPTKFIDTIKILLYKENPSLLERLDFDDEKELKNLGLQISQLQSEVIDLNRNSKTTEVNKKMDKINLLRNALQSFNQLKKAIQDWELQYVLSSSLSEPFPICKSGRKAKR